MPYALTGRDGEEPAWRLIGDPSEVEPGEVVVEEEPGEGEVWDSGAGGLRPKRDAEELEEAKARKTEEVAAAAVDAVAPMFTPCAGRDETVLLVAGHVLKVCEALSVSVDPRLRALVATGEKALALKAEAEAAGSVEELEAVSWT